MKNQEKVPSYQGKFNVLLVLSVVSLGIYIGLNNRSVEFEEISVERINIVEKSGLKRMVLANSDRAPGVEKLGGEVFRPSSPRPGMIFYNDEGTENGGFIFRGGQTGDETSHGLHLSFDRYNQDQTLMVQHIEQLDYMVTGLTVMDRPAQDMDFELSKELTEAKKRNDRERVAQILRRYKEEKLGGTRRAFYGTLNGDSKLQLNDADGKKRIQLIVTKDGEAKLEFLDVNGQVIMSLPQ
ncbi:hypothetical protein ACJJIF_20425 [Microbulbifer sp. SSSA002]|uniref:hypothetical protein n=1 Tax=unclassified Microbulbifer TaxID=2619833 RepID=UPI0040392AAF